MSNKKECVKVAVRCRPLSTTQKLRKYQNMIEIDEQQGQITVKDIKQRLQEQRIFSFDMVFGQHSQQESVFNEAALPIIQSTLEGYNGTIFAYGQTGTGKTFTMEGCNTIDAKSRLSDSQKGIIPRTFQHIIKSIEGSPYANFMITVSMLEIYNQQIIDLLSEDRKNKLQIHQSKDQGVFVRNLSQFTVSSVKEMKQKLRQGSQLRHTGSTDMNSVSSRSHSIFIIKIEQQQIAQNQPKVRVGKLNLVDLAGSQRLKKTDGSNNRKIEGIHINSALLTLGQVIGALTNSQNSYVPYRDSKLTRLLQQSLGGNAKTVMIANIGPASYNYKETINTLRYASQTKKIKNRPKINQDPHDAMIRQYQQEIMRLRKMLQQCQSRDPRVLRERRQNQVTQEFDRLMQRQRKMMLLYENSSSTRELIDKQKWIAQIHSKQKMRQEQLIQRINLMNQKLLHGNKLKEEARIHEKRIFEAHQQLQERKQLQRRLQNDFDRAVKAQQTVQFKNLSLKQQVQNRNNYLLKLDSKLKVAERQNNDILEFLVEQRGQLQQQNRAIVRQLKLVNMIIEKFVPLDKVAQILSAKIDEPTKSCEADFTEQQTIAMGNSKFNTTQNKKTFHRNAGTNENHENEQFTATGYFRHFNKMKTRGRQRQHINSNSNNCNNRNNLNRQKKSTNESIFSKKELPVKLNNEQRNQTQNVRKVTSHQELVTNDQWNTIFKTTNQKQSESNKNMTQTSYSIKKNNFRKICKPPVDDLTKISSKIKQGTDTYKNSYQQNKKPIDYVLTTQQQKDRVLRQIYGEYDKKPKSKKSNGIKKRIYKKQKQFRGSQNSDDCSSKQPFYELKSNKIKNQAFNKRFLDQNAKSPVVNYKTQEEQNQYHFSTHKIGNTPNIKSFKKLSKQQNLSPGKRSAFKISQMNKKNSNKQQNTSDKGQLKIVMKNLELQHLKMCQKQVCFQKEQYRDQRNPKLMVHFQPQLDQNKQKFCIKRVIRDSEKNRKQSQGAMITRRQMVDQKQQVIEVSNQKVLKQCQNNQLLSQRSNMKSNQRQSVSSKQDKQYENTHTMLPNRINNAYATPSNGLSTNRSKKSVNNVKSNKKSESLHSPFVEQQDLDDTYDKQHKRNISTSNQRKRKSKHIFDQINENEKNDSQFFKRSSQVQDNDSSQDQQSNDSHSAAQKDQDLQESQRDQNQYSMHEEEQKSESIEQVRNQSQNQSNNSIVNTHRSKIITKETNKTRIRIPCKAQILTLLYGPEIQIQKNKFEHKQYRLNFVLDQPQNQVKKDSKIWNCLSGLNKKDYNIFIGKSLQVQELSYNKYNLSNFRKIIKILAQKDQKLLIRLFQNTQNSQINNGRVLGVWLCDNYEWKCVTLNKQVPVDQNSNFLFCYHKNKLLWPIILEKAIALLLGGYQKLMNASTGQLFHILTGNSFSNFKIREDLSKNQKAISGIIQAIQKKCLIHAQKQCMSLQQHYQVEKQGKIYYIVGYRKNRSQNMVDSEGQLWLKLKQQGKQAQWIKVQKFVSKFKSIQILDILASQCKTVSITIPQDKKQSNMAVFQLNLNHNQSTKITLSNKQPTQLKLFAYKYQKDGMMKLIGDSVQKSRKAISIQKQLRQGKYYIFCQSAKIQSRITVSGQYEVLLCSRQNFTYLRQLKRFG